jgi:hypothetical protein
MLSRFVDRVVFQPSPGIDLRISDLGIEGEEVHLDSDGVILLVPFETPERSCFSMAMRGMRRIASPTLPSSHGLALTCS